MDYDVSFYIAAHEHSYERINPKFMNWTDDISASHIMKVSDSINYIIEGIAGNDDMEPSEICNESSLIFS